MLERFFLFGFDMDSIQMEHVQNKYKFDIDTIQKGIKQVLL